MYHLVSGLLSFVSDILLSDNDLTSHYDWFIVTRADYLYLCPHKPLHTMDERYLYVPASESYRGYTDRHLVVSKVRG